MVDVIYDPCEQCGKSHGATVTIKRGENDVRMIHVFESRDLMRQVTNIMLGDSMPDLPGHMPPR